jgi:hypothetical protein
VSKFTETLKDRRAIFEVICIVLAFMAMDVQLWVQWATGTYSGAKGLGHIPPDATSAQVAAYYLEHAHQIRVSALLYMLSGGFYMLQGCVLYVWMRRIEMQNHLPPILSMFQFANCAITIAVSVVGPALLFSAAAYHPERNPEITHICNDLATMGMFYAAGPWVFFLASIGGCILMDKGHPKVLPRWLGYYNILAAILTTPAFTIPFYYTGPGAWNGKAALGIVIIFTGPVWCVLMTVTLIRAAIQQRKIPYGSPPIGNPIPAE